VSDVKPLTEQEERDIRTREARLVTMQAPLSPPGYVPIDEHERDRLFATLDALRAELAQVTRERDEAKWRAGIVTEAIEDFLMRDVPNRARTLVVPGIGVTVVAFAVDSTLPIRLAARRFSESLFGIQDDRYKREAMAARALDDEMGGDYIHEETDTCLCCASDVKEDYPSHLASCELVAYRAIRAENEEREKGDERP